MIDAMMAAMTKAMTKSPVPHSYILHLPTIAQLCPLDLIPPMYSHPSSLLFHSSGSEPLPLCHASHHQPTFQPTSLRTLPPPRS